MASDKRYQNFIINNHLLSTYQKNLLILSNVIFSKLIIWVYLIRYSYKTKNLLHLIYGRINILADRQTSCLMLFILHFSTLFTFFFGNLLPDKDQVFNVRESNKEDRS